ncbi:unnamed protein product [Diamesa hyperborea]
MKFIFSLSALFALIALATAQFGVYNGDFGGPSGFSAGFPSAALTAGARDPRQNRGPVVFPQSPPDAPEESSGVVVGASGFGFVPPNQQNFRRSFNFY